MKGLKIERAKPSNAIDIYPLLEKCMKGGHFVDDPSLKELKNYYFANLIPELGSPMHFWYLARRGKGFYGFLHAIVVPRRWDGTPESMFVDTVFVQENKRKLGIGAKLIDELQKDAENIGVRKLEFLCPEDQLEMWSSKRSAEKVNSVMRIDI